MYGVEITLQPIKTNLNRSSGAEPTIFSTVPHSLCTNLSKELRQIPQYSKFFRMTNSSQNLNVRSHWTTNSINPCTRLVFSGYIPADKVDMRFLFAVVKLETIPPSWWQINWLHKFLKPVWNFLTFCWHMSQFQKGAFLSCFVEARCGNTPSFNLRHFSSLLFSLTEQVLKTFIGSYLDEGLIPSHLSSKNVDYIPLMWKWCSLIFQKTLSSYHRKSSLNRPFWFLIW